MGNNNQKPKIPEINENNQLTSNLYQTQFNDFYKYDKPIQYDKIYSDINSFFTTSNKSTINMTKIRNSSIILTNNQQIWISIYYAKISCMLCNNQRYIIAISPIDDVTIGESKLLSDIKWISFQTRTFTNIDIPFNLIAQNYKGEIYSDSILNNESFQIESRDDKKSTYIAVKYPLKIELLHNSKQLTKNDSADKIHLVSALDTYNCIITII